MLAIQLDVGGAREEGSTFNLSISRLVGTFGTITVGFEIVDAATLTLASSDFQAPLNGTVTFLPGQAVAFLLVTSINDTLPELEEQFYVRLVNPTGGATVSSVSQEVLSLLPSDMPYGSFAVQQNPSVQIVNGDDAQR